MNRDVTSHEYHRAALLRVEDRVSAVAAVHARFGGKASEFVAMIPRQIWDPMVHRIEELGGYFPEKVTPKKWPIIHTVAGLCTLMPTPVGPDIIQVFAIDPDAYMGASPDSSTAADDP